MKKVLLVIVYCLALLLGGTAVKYKMDHTFSTARWLKAPHERVRIIDDLFSKYELVGMTTSQLIELLGEETDNAYFKQENNRVYYLGDERGIVRIDSEWLVLTIEDDRVVEVALKTD